MSGPMLMVILAVLAGAGVIAAAFVVRTRRVVATPTERAVHAALHTASLAARALREGLGPDSARAAAPHLRALTGVEGVVVFDGDGGLLVRDPPDDRHLGTGSGCRVRTCGQGVDRRSATGVERAVNRR